MEDVVTMDLLFMCGVRSVSSLLRWSMVENWIGQYIVSYPCLESQMTACMSTHSGQMCGGEVRKQPGSADSTEYYKLLISSGV